MSNNFLEKCHFLPGGGPENWGIRYFLLDQKEGSKVFFQIKQGDHLYFLNETKYFVKHFRFQRKRLSNATLGRKLQWDLLSQCKNVQLDGYNNMTDNTDIM